MQDLRGLWRDAMMGGMMRGMGGMMGGRRVGWRHDGLWRHGLGLRRHDVQMMMGRRHGRRWTGDDGRRDGRGRRHAARAPTSGAPTAARHARRRTKAVEAAKGPSLFDPYYNIVEVKVYGQARFYNPPPAEPEAEPSPGETAATPRPGARPPRPKPAKTEASQGRGAGRRPSPPRPSRPRPSRPRPSPPRPSQPRPSRAKTEPAKADEPQDGRSAKP